MGETSGAEIHEGELASQFRCNGSDGYIAWVDNALQIRETPNYTLDGIDYDFQVCSSASELRAGFLKRTIWAASRGSWRATVGIGQARKIVVRPTSNSQMKNFAMQWNLTDDGSLWILKAKSIDQIGCIHTCQGLELDYVGVIVGPDLIVRDEVILTRPEFRSKQDSSIKGYKALKEISPKKASKLADDIIKNTYRTLMTRGQKGCYIFCTDPETNLWFRSRLHASVDDADIEGRYPGLTLRILPSWEVQPFVNGIPIYDLQVAAGLFSEEQIVEDHDWVELSPEFRIQEGLFVTQVVGESMNRRIPNGSWCLFRANPVGTRQGKIVLVQHQSIRDLDTGGRYTVKTYQSEKVVDADS